MGFFPRQHIERVVEHAVRYEKLSHFLALMPDNAYGIAVLRMFEEALAQHGVHMDHMEWYGEADETLSVSINRLLEHPQPVEAEEHMRGEVLFIPEGGARLHSIATRLAHHEADKRFRYLGTGEWDDRTLEKQKYLSGGWFATTSLYIREDFEANFRHLYDYAPLRIASLGYDAMALIIELLEHYPEAPFDRGVVTRERGFLGVNGAYRFLENGTAERQLSIIEMTAFGFGEISQAQEFF